MVFKDRVTDEQLEERVRAALEREPRVANPRDVAITVAAGAATLRGTVPSFKQRHACVEAAKRVMGVEYVVDELTVKWFGDQRSDDELRGAALQALIWDVEVPDDAIDMKVTNGWVTLKGDVDSQFQSDAAFNDVASPQGVVALSNEIIVVNPRR
jgi:osmotically-inducible protein OsmY